MTPPPSTARLVLNRDLPDERAAVFDLYGAEPWVRPLLRVEGETRRVSETGVPIVRAKLDVDTVNGLDLQKQTLFVRSGKGRKDRVVPVPRKPFTSSTGISTTPVRSFFTTPRSALSS